jgi:hypothetical protein
VSRPVYSTQFISYQGLNGVGPTVYVPVGHTYVVKQLTWYSNPLLGPTRGYFRDLGSGAALFSAGTPDGQPAWYGFYGALVFEEGASFRWETSALLTDGVDVSASGYDLDNAG